MYPLNMGLGSYSLKDATLLQTALMKDPGGRLGIPNFATASPKILDEHKERVEKLFCCLMNYIYHTCELYKESMREYNNDGVLLYQRVRG